MGSGGGGERVSGDSGDAISLSRREVKRNKK